MTEPDSIKVPYFPESKPYAETKVGFMAQRRMLNKVGGIGESLRD